MYPMPYPPQPMPRKPSAWPQVRRRLVLPLLLLTVGLFTGLLRTKAGLIALVLAWVVIGLLANARAGGHTFRALFEYVAVFGLAMALAVALFGADLSGLETPKIAVTAQAPTQAETQTKVQEFRQSIIDFIQRATAERGAQLPAPKKEHR